MKTQSTNNAKKRGYIALLITCFFWGTTWVASKMAVKEMPSLQLAATRQLLAGCSFVFYFLFFKKLKIPTTRQFVWIVGMSILMFVFANWLSTLGLQYIPTGLAALIGALYPLSVVLIEAIFIKSRKITVLTLLGMILGLVGVGMVFYDTLFKNLPEKMWVGILLSTIAMLSWSLGTVLLSRNKTNINPYYATGWQMILSALILAMASIITHQYIPLMTIQWKVWIEIFYLVVFGSVLSFVAFIFSTKVLSPEISSLYAYVNPLVAIFVASIILNEPLSINIFFGAIVTLFGVFLVNYSNYKNKIIAEPEM